MDKPSVKKFITWCDQASDEALKGKRREVIDTLENVYTPSVKNDLKLLLRLIDEEAMARLDLELLRQSR